MSVLATIDWVVIALYFAIILGVAWWIIRQNKATSDDYFLAGRNLGWFVVGASIFASNIGQVLNTLWDWPDRALPMG